MRFFQIFIIIAAFATSACASVSSVATHALNKTDVDPKYGVKASPRIVSDYRPIKRGGGRAQIGKPYKVAGKWYTPREQPHYKARGQASWYGDAFHGRLTANGEIYDMNTLSAAHPTLPLPSYVKVTNLKNGRHVVVRVNDRGPFAHNRIIDLSKRAADVLDLRNDGIGPVEVTYIGKARLDGQDVAWLESTISHKSSGNAAVLASKIQAPRQKRENTTQISHTQMAAYAPQPFTKRTPSVSVMQNRAPAQMQTNSLLNLIPAHQRPKYQPLQRQYASPIQVMKPPAPLHAAVPPPAF